MLKIKKSICMICAVSVCTLTFAACSKDKNTDTADALDADKINSEYDKIVSSASDDVALSDADILGGGFTENDFTVTSPDDTDAFSIDNNSFVKITPTDTYYNYIEPGKSEPEICAGSYKTGKFLGITNSVSDFISAYNITDKSALCKNEAGSYSSPVNGMFAGKLTVVYGLNKDGVYEEFKTDALKQFLSIRDDNSGGTMYFNPGLITSAFEQYTTIASLDLTVDASGQLTEIVISRFER